MTYDYDMIVIGAGAAGLTAAGMSALLGAKTALIEEHRLGGECTWTGCIPSKTLLRAARLAHEMRTADRFGLAVSAPQFPFGDLMQHVRAIRQQVYEQADAPPNMERLGVEVIAGSAQFTGPHSIQVSGRVWTSRYFVIATGSRPKQPKFSEPCLSNETLFEINALPARLLVLGGGPIGMEMAQAFQRLGSTVTIVGSDSRILPKDDPQHARMLQDCLASEGISFILGHKASAVERQGGELSATLDDSRTIRCDAVLAAIGREANMANLKLESAGVEYGARGIRVDRRCRTNQKHIFATGDVTGQHQFTHMAEHMSKVAVTNAILGWPATVDEKHAVWSTFTEPELAHLGESEAELSKRGARYLIYRLPFEKLDRAITEAQTGGEIKVMATKSGQILGASIIGANAGEMISEYALAMRNGISLSKIAATIHPYPTYALGNRKTADLASFKQLDSPLLALFGKLRGLRGVRKGSAAL